jgi:formamidopyrimidine-DNA glycosylase
MPELPEVETIKNELLPHIAGRCVKRVTLLWDGVVKQPSAEEFCSRLTGQRLTGVARRGKYLIFSLSSDESLIIHLRMTGALLLKPASAGPDKYTRAILHLDEGVQLHFNDMRKLGMMRLTKDINSVVGKLGPEPLEDSFAPHTLLQRLNRRKAPIKALLLDQTLIAGIGNMYADEALFAARIHPLRPGCSLTRSEVGRLHHAIRQVLQAAIENKGASVATYLRPDGKPGTAHFQFQVAHRGGEPCPICGTPIQRIAIRNRGTYFCPCCQLEKV